MRVNGGESYIEDRLNMFLAVCAADRVRHQKMEDKKDGAKRYQLSGSKGEDRKKLAKYAKTLIVKYMADGGQDLRRAED